jgi:hypothetical protein
VTDFLIDPYLVPATDTLAASSGSPLGTVPPRVGLPVDRVPGTYPDIDNDRDEISDRTDGYDALGPQLVIAPTPIIGAVPFGGIIIGSGEWIPPQLGSRFTIGDTGEGRPQNTAISLWTDSTTLWLELVPDSAPDAPVGVLLPLLTPAAAIPQPLTIPARRLTVRARALPSAAAMLRYWIVGYPMGS